MLNGNEKENLGGQPNFDFMYCDSMSLDHSSLVSF